MVIALSDGQFPWENEDKNHWEKIRAARFFLTEKHGGFLSFLFFSSFPGGFQCLTCFFFSRGKKGPQILVRFDSHGPKCTKTSTIASGNLP